jgi:hypothetical protein
MGIKEGIGNQLQAALLVCRVYRTGIREEEGLITMMAPKLFFLIHESRNRFCVGFKCIIEVPMPQPSTRKIVVEFVWEAVETEPDSNGGIFRRK